jgi:acyl carrier protein
MNKQDLFKIISEALEVDSVDENSSMDNLDEWDSLGHLSILSAIDQELDGKASKLSALAGATSVSSIIIILEENNLMQ